MTKKSIQSASIKKENKKRFRQGFSSYLINCKRRYISADSPFKDKTSESMFNC